jgi:flagellar basal-body rod modification protein FlgD
MIINGTHATNYSGVGTAATNGSTGTNGGTGTGTAGTTGTTGTTGTGTTGSTGTSGGSGGVNGAATLGGTDFLTLMLAQLQNQDPTQPVDSNTFLTQLAELSEVQGITQLNTSFSSLSSSINANQALQASSLLGHTALVTSTTAQLAAGGSISGAVSVPQNTSAVVVSIQDASGNVVQTLGLGAQSAGNASFTWDGKEQSGALAPAGTYTFNVQYAGQTSSSTAATTMMSGTVESVSMGSGSTGLTLNVAGVGSVPFSSLQQIND